MKKTFAKKISIMLLAASTGVSLSMATQKADAHWLFSDIDHVPWALESILNGYQMGVISGMDNSLFVPNDNVTREQFIKMITKGLNPNVDNPLKIDMTPENEPWSHKYMKAAKDMGIMEATDAIFNQNISVPITRGETAVLISRAANKSFKGKVVDYATAVSFCKVNGFLDGRAGEDMALNETLTRAEAAVVIDRLSRFMNIYASVSKKPTVQANSGQFSLNGVKLGMSSKEVRSILGEPLYSGYVEERGDDALVYKEQDIYLFDDHVISVSYKGLDEDLKENLMRDSDSAIFQGENLTFFFYANTKNLIMIKGSDKTITLGVGDGNFDAFAANVYTPINMPAKAYANLLKTKDSLRELNTENSPDTWRVKAALSNLEQAPKVGARVAEFVAAFNKKQFDSPVVTQFFTVTPSNELMQKHYAQFAPFDIKTVYYSSSMQGVYVSVLDKNNLSHEFNFFGGEHPESWLYYENGKAENLLSPTEAVVDKKPSSETSSPVQIFNTSAQNIESELQSGKAVRKQDVPASLAEDFIKAFNEKEWNSKAFTEFLAKPIHDSTKLEEYYKAIGPFDLNSIRTVESSPPVYITVISDKNGDLHAFYIANTKLVKWESPGFIQGTDMYYELTK